jgi:hypothetical protein
MPRYFFNVRDRYGFTPDAEGVELANAVAARKHALAGARSLICDDVTAGILDLGGCITVLDENGNVVVEILFNQTVLSG